MFEKKKLHNAIIITQCNFNTHPANKKYSTKSRIKCNCNKRNKKIKNAWPRKADHAFTPFLHSLLRTTNSKFYLIRKLKHWHLKLDAKWKIMVGGEREYQKIRRFDRRRRWKWEVFGNLGVVRTEEWERDEREGVWRIFSVGGAC